MTLPVFETARLTLRAITAHDAEGLHEVQSAAHGMNDGPRPALEPTTLSVLRPMTESEFASWLAIYLFKAIEAEGS